MVAKERVQNISEEYILKQNQKVSINHTKYILQLPIFQGLSYNYENPELCDK